MGAVRNIGTILAVLTLAGIQIVSAQSLGTQRFANPFPETGRWFSNDGSRSGFFFEIQNGILAGAFFGFDNNGNDVWLTFSGELEPREVADRPPHAVAGPPFQNGWRIEAQMFRFADGKCILNCDPAGGALMPTSETVGQVVIEFSGRSEGSYWIDGSGPTPIVPLYFGNAAFAFDPVRPLRFLPNFTGTWVEVSDPELDGVDADNEAGIVVIGERQVVEIPSAASGERFLEVWYPILEGIRFEDAEISCIYIQDALDNPFCSLVFSVGPMESFSSDFDSITDTRFTMFSIDDAGIRTRHQTFIRLNYD